MFAFDHWTRFRIALSTINIYPGFEFIPYYHTASNFKEMIMFILRMTLRGRYKRLDLASLDINQNIWARYGWSKCWRVKLSHGLIQSTRDTARVSNLLIDPTEQHPPAASTKQTHSSTQLQIKIHKLSCVLILITGCSQLLSYPIYIPLHMITLSNVIFIYSRFEFYPASSHIFETSMKGLFIFRMT